jgi:hypothetical protein
MTALAALERLALALSRRRTAAADVLSRCRPITDMVW